METDQEKQLDALLHQSAKILNKNHENEETDASTTSKRDNRSPSPFDNQDIKTGIVMAEKRDTSLTILVQLLERSGASKSIIEPQKVAPVDLGTSKDHLEKRNNTIP